MKNVKQSLEKISKTLGAAHSSREFLLKNSRDILILCSQSIISAHKGDLVSSKTKAKKAKSLLVKLQQKGKGDLSRYVIPVEQELVEAFSLIAIIEKKEIPSYKTLGVSGDSYVLGLLDCIGELKRLIFDRMRIGKSKEALHFFDIMENLYLSLYPLASYDKILKESRRKLDVNRILVEETRSALTEDIRRSELIDAINKLK